jgi:two-component system alkaline phosphatase synthesis response regulator PhoP
LLLNRGKVLTRNQLLDDIHNDDSFVVDRNIDVHIAALRRKLGPNFKWIDTVRGVGYRFKGDANETYDDVDESYEFDELEEALV